MLRLTTRSTEKHLLLLLMWPFMVMTAAQPRCDPLTQYERNGQCCKMCGPGTSMSSHGTCSEPQCNDCGENEYQEKYTSELKCRRQPYCDRNKNFQVPVHESKKRSTCMCELGFHCSSEECLTCVPHNTCEPGHGVRSKGNQTRNTVCQECPQGTFSKESSWDGVCKEWTECTNGFHVKQKGTDISDNICEKSSRTHLVIAVLLPLILVLLIVAVLLWRFKGDVQGKLKLCCVESCLEEKKETQREAKGLIAVPADPAEESTLPEEQLSHDEGFTRAPVENEDEPNQEMSTDVLFTDKGNYVTQENGKKEILSRQESQTQTFID